VHWAEGFWSPPLDPLIVQVTLGPSDDGIDPNTGRRIGCGLQIVASLLCFDNESAMWTSALRGIQVIQINLVDGL